MKYLYFKWFCCQRAGSLPTSRQIQNMTWNIVSHIKYLSNHTLHDVFKIKNISSYKKKKVENNNNNPARDGSGFDCYKITDMWTFVCLPGCRSKTTG